MGCLSSLCLHQRIYGRTMVSTIAATRAMTMTADMVFFCFGLIITINLLQSTCSCFTRFLISYTLSKVLASTYPRCNLMALLDVVGESIGRYGKNRNRLRIRAWQRPNRAGCRE